MSRCRLSVAALLLAAATPTTAATPPQSPQVPFPPSQFPPTPSMATDQFGSQPRLGERRGALFAKMSPEGRATMRAAMRAADRRDNRAKIQATRDRMLAVLEAERLDTVALKRAMDAERDAADAMRAEHQAALLAGFIRLSLADRRVFVADARGMRSRIAEKVKAFREARDERRRATPPDAN